VKRIKAAFLTATLTLGCLLIVLGVCLAEMLVLSLYGYVIRLCPPEAWYAAVAFVGGIFIILHAINAMIEEVMK